MPRRSRNEPPPIKPVRLAEAIEAFFANLPNDLASGTRRHKDRTLRAVTRAAGSNTMTDIVTTTFLSSVLADLASSAGTQEARDRQRQGLRPRTGRSAASLSQDRTTLKQFLKFCQRERFVGYWVQVPGPITYSAKETGQARRDRRFIPVEDFAEILDIAGSIHPRVRMAVAINLLWCRRISEVVDARSSYITADPQQRLVARLRNIKRGRMLPDIIVDWGMESEINRWRTWITSTHGVPQPDWYLVPARLAVKDFWHLREMRRIAEEDRRAWPVDPTRPTIDTNLRMDYHKVLQLYGWDDTRGEGGHTFRRSGAKAFQIKYGLAATQALLDHESPATTFRYTHNVEGQDKLDAAMMGGDVFEILSTPNVGDVIPFKRKQA